MYKSHLLRFLKSKLRAAFTLVFVMVPTLDLIFFFISKYNNLHFTKCYPPYGAFFAIGGGNLQCIIIWLLPIFLLLMVADDAVTDYKTGYANIVSSKVGKRAYLREKLSFSFSMSFLAMMLALLLNLLGGEIALHGQTYCPFENDTPKNLLYTWSLFHPLAADLGFALVAAFLSGLAGMMSAALCILLRERKYAYPAAFGLWFALIIPDKTLALVFQPFSEYGFAELIPIFLFATVYMLAITILIYFFEVYYVEI